MKALVLAGGLGSRLRPLTQTGAKQLLPVGNKPIIHYVLEDIRDAGITQVSVVIGEETAVGIRQNLQDGQQWGLEITYIFQDQPLGLAHCVMLAEDSLGLDSFVMYLGDNLLKNGIGTYASSFERSGGNALTLLANVVDPSEFGVAEFDSNNQLKRLVEKPKLPPSHWAMTGVYFFDHHIFDAVRAIQPSQRGELEITDAIQWLIDNDWKVDYEMLTDWWKDAGSPNDLLESNALILQDLKGSVDPSANIDDQSTIIGEVQIEADVEITRSVIRGPAILGSGTVIKDAYIGTSTSLGSKSLVINSEISFSIVMEGANIVDVQTPIDWSLVGRGAIVSRGQKRPRALNLVIGDMSRLELV